MSDVDSAGQAHYLQNVHGVRNLALSDLAIDSKSRCSDVVSRQVRDVSYGDQLLPRALIDLSRGEKRSAPYNSN
jgi:hypothetical protein